MDTNTIAAGGTTAEAVNTAAQTEVPLTTAPEAAPVPQPEPAAEIAVVNTPAAEPTISNISSTPPPTVTIAGLEAPHPIAARAGLWRKIRPEAPASAAKVGPKPKAPVIAPPRQETSAAPPAIPSRSGRFALLAASIGLVAGLGAAAGAAGFAGVMKLAGQPAKPAPAYAAMPVPLQRSELIEETKGLKESLAHVRGSVRLLVDSVAAIRTNVDNSGKNTGAQVSKLGEQLAKLNETVDRLERSQSEPAARLAKVTETLERLERRAAAMANTPDPTERRAAATAAAPVPAAAPTPALSAGSETTAAITPPTGTPVIRGSEPSFLRPPIVEGWTVRRVYDGVAYIEGPDRMVEVEAGDNIRGVGRVQEIKRQGSRWVVVTNRGLIFSR